MPKLTIKLKSDSFRCYYEFKAAKAQVLKPVAFIIYNMFIHRLRLSVKLGINGMNGKRFYNPAGQFFYIVFSIDELVHTIPCKTSERSINRALNQLEEHGLILRHGKEHYTQIQLPKINITPKKSEQSTSSIFNQSAKRQTGTPQTANLASKCKNRKRRTDKMTDNTINTEKAQPSNFVKMDPLDSWVDSVNSQRAGLTLGTSNCIAEFCSKHFKLNPVSHCKQIYKIMVEARGSVLKHSHKHLDRKAVRFESNDNIRTGLEPKLRKVFTKVININSIKLNVNHFASYLMTSLENFFQDALGLNEQEVVTPQSNIQYHGRKPIKEGMPQWWKDQKTNEESEKLKPTDPNLIKQIQERLARLDE